MITCCKGCVAPRRFPGCHAVCDDYRREKEQCEKERIERNKRKLTEYELYSQRSEAVRKTIGKR